jgi:putative ATPase
MVLFKEEILKFEEPLAYRMRPKTFEEFVGQEEIAGEGTFLRRAIQEDKLPSFILWGPPGSGKTSLAEICANLTKSHFEKFSAVTSTVEDIRKVIKAAKQRYSLYSQRTILFIDEIHRFNKLQQDAFLPYVEDGTIILIGATTQNPYFNIISPLLSRLKIYRLKPLNPEDIEKIIKRALENEEKGIAKFNVVLEEDAFSYIINISNGDARVALNTLEISALTTPPDKNGIRRISLKTVEEICQKRFLTYDRDGDSHYDTISAFIKSMRGSDPDAALYWLARMLYCGEDPRFIARRMIICAAEDVGCADPLALLVATSAASALEYVGMPEAQIPLAEAAIYIATAPKSNAVYKGISKAMEDVEKLPNYPVPLHLRDANYSSAKILGHQKNYKYPHNYPNNYVSQDYVPENIKNRRYYFPTENGEEKKIKERLEKLRKEK